LRSSLVVVLPIIGFFHRISTIIIHLIVAFMATAKQSSPIVAEKYQDYIFIALIALSVIVFLSKAIFGAGFNSSDNIASNSFIPYLEQADKSGNYPLWIPYIFSGMPSYAALLTTGDRSWDITSEVIMGVASTFGKIFGSDVARIAFWYILYGIGMYLLIRSKKHERPVALFTALSAVFSTFVIVWVMIGHNTKPVTLSMFPFVILGLEKIRERWSLLYAVLMVVAVHVMIESTHLQMVFYGICTFGLYLLFELVSRVISKEQPMGVLRAAGVLAVAGGLSYAMASDRFMTTQEYVPYSTRGSAPIGQLASANTPNSNNTPGKSKQDINGGNDYEYATNWSFSPGEVMTFFVPNYYGFGKLDDKGLFTANKEDKLPTYYGQMPFTDAANYMGIGVLFLAIFGAYHYRKDAFVQFLIALSIFSVLLSFGKNGSFLYDFFYNVVPNFNKFRAPSMALAMIQFAVPLLSAFGITALASLRGSEPTGKQKSSPPIPKSVMVFVSACALFLVLGFIYPSLFESDFKSAVTSSESLKQYYGEQNLGQVSDFIFDEMSSDWKATGFILLLMAGAVLLYVRRSINGMIFYSAIILLVVADLWRVAYRPMEVAKKPLSKEVFNTTDYIEFLKNDKGIFRIADIQALASPNVAAYHKLENIHGYHSAKLRVYQDLLDEAGNGGGSIIANPTLWDIMNVKYILATRPLFQGQTPVFESQTSQVKVYANPGFMPRAFFVNHAVVADKMEILKHLKNGDFNPRDTAFIETKLPTAIEPADSTATVTVLAKANESMTLDVTASGNNLLYISEVFYPVSWKATIDGVPTEIHKTNFAFRSIVVPKGKHKVELRFESASFQTGKSLSLGANIVVLLCAIAAVFLEIKSKKQSDSDKPSQSTTSA
jgi:hypothetical protein